MPAPAPSTIPQLPNGLICLPTDLLPVSRSGTTYGVTLPPNVLPGMASEILQAGQAVCIKSDGTYGLAQANSSTRYKVVGFALANYSVSNVVYFAQFNVQLSGPLTPGAIYYLSDSSAGAITATKPTASGSYVVQVGIAVSSTVLNINIGTYPTTSL